MLCILKMDGDKITGWIIASSLRNAKKQARAVGQHDLAEVLEIFSMSRGARQTLLGGKYLVLGQ